MVLGESCLVGILGGILGVAIGCVFLQILNGASPQLFRFAVHELAGVWLAWLVTRPAAPPGTQPSKPSASNDSV